MKFSQWLIETLKARELSQAELARKIGITKAAVNRWTLGLSVPTLKIHEMNRLCNALSCDLEEIAQVVDEDSR